MKSIEWFLPFINRLMCGHCHIIVTWLNWLSSFFQGSLLALEAVTVFHASKIICRLRHTVLQTDASLSIRIRNQEDILETWQRNKISGHVPYNSVLRDGLERRGAERGNRMESHGRGWTHTDVWPFMGFYISCFLRIFRYMLLFRYESINNWRSYNVLQALDHFSTLYFSSLHHSFNIRVYMYACMFEGVFKSFRTESIKKWTTKINTRSEAMQRVIAAKLTRLTYKIAT